MSETPTWNDVLSSFENAVIAVLKGFADAVSANAQFIAKALVTLSVIGVLAYGLTRIPIISRFLRLPL